MKSLWIASILLLSCITASHAQSDKELEPGYYVVVAAYSANRENVAQNYTEVLNLQGLKARYGFNSSKKFYFVYLDYATQLKPAIREMYKRRKAEQFSDAWVRVISGPVAATSNDVKAVEPVSTAPAVETVTIEEQDPPVVVTEQKTEIK